MHLNEAITLTRLKDFQHELLQKVAPLLAPEHWPILDSIEIILNTRMRTALGRAYYARIIAGQLGGFSRFEKPRIELNSRVLAKHLNEIAPTFAHELAHIVAPLLYGRLGLNHQSGWQKVMELFGYDAERTHDLNLRDMQRAQKPVAFATCGCDGIEHEIKARRYKKIKRGRTRYICLQCNQPLHLKKPLASISHGSKDL